MPLNDRVTSLAKRVTAMFATLLAAVLVAAFGAALTPGVASAAPGDEIDASLVQASTDVGGPWTKISAFAAPWDQSQPSPGLAGENRTTFYIKNASTVPVITDFYLGLWSVSKGSAYFAVEVDGVRGPVTTLTSTSANQPGVLVRSANQAASGVAKVTFIVGIPATEQAQNATITPAWSVQMADNSSTTPPVAPAAPTALTAAPSPATVNAPVSIGGKAELGTTVNVTAGGLTCVAQTQSDGSFSCDITPTTAGTLSVTATATRDGLTSGTATAISLNVQAASAAPAAPTALAATPNPVTAGNPVVISGKAEVGATVKVTASSGQSCDAVVQPNGDFSCSITPAAAGDVTVTAKASKGGLTSPASASVTLTVKPVDIDPVAPPAPTGLTVSPASVAPNTVVTVSGKAAPGATVKVTASNGQTCEATAQANGDFSCSITPTSAGAITVTATASQGGLTSPEAPAVTLTVADAGNDGTGSLGSMGGSLDLGSLTSLFGSAAGTPANARAGTPAAAPFAGSLGSLTLHT